MNGDGRPASALQAGARRVQPHRLAHARAARTPRMGRVRDRRPAARRGARGARRRHGSGGRRRCPTSTANTPACCRSATTRRRRPPCSTSCPRAATPTPSYGPRSRRRAAAVAPPRSSPRAGRSPHAAHAGAPACARRCGTGCAAPCSPAPRSPSAGSFDYFRDMTGLDRDVDVDERVFASPFDFRPTGRAGRSSTIRAARGGRQSSPPARPSASSALAEVTGGRTLALFTNTRDMHQVAAAVGAHVEDDGVLVLAQGMHGSAAALAEEFRSHPGTILLGVDTLWTGQDFPGDALICLVIAKLPFPRQDPLFRARRQRLRRTRANAGSTASTCPRPSSSSGRGSAASSAPRPTRASSSCWTIASRRRPTAATSSAACPRWRCCACRPPRSRRWSTITCGACRRVCESKTRPR